MPPLHVLFIYGVRELYRRFWQQLFAISTEIWKVTEVRRVETHTHTQIQRVQALCLA